MAKCLPERVFDFLAPGPATRKQMLCLLDEGPGDPAEARLDEVLRELRRRKAIWQHVDGTYERVPGANPRFTRRSGKVACMARRRVTREEVPKELQALLDQHLHPRTRDGHVEWLVVGGDVVGFGEALAGLWADTFDDKE